MKHNVFKKAKENHLTKVQATIAIGGKLDYQNLNKKWKYILIILFCCISTSDLWAYDFIFNGICYKKLSDSDVCVTSGTTYSGTVSIPSKFKYQGATYNVVGIGEKAFYQCTGLTRVVLSKSITSIGFGAFEGSGLTTLTVPNQVTEIGSWAFALCKDLISISLPDGVKSIGEYAFYGCEQLKSVNIPANVTRIEAFSFQDCQSLSAINIPAGITFIGNSAFSGCTGLTTLLIPDGVKTIELGAFSGCSGLTSIKIPSTLNNIADFAFSYCGKLTSITIPQTVSNISSYAFAGCKGLQTISIPQSVLNLGIGSFSKCIGLTSASLPNSINSIPNNLFEGCERLTTFTIPNSVTRIGREAFLDCKELKILTMTYKVNNIDDKAFGRLDQLSNINCRASNPPVVQDSSFAYSNLITLHVLSGKKEIYQNANLWQKFNIKDDLLPIEGDSLVFDKQIYAVKVGNIEEVHLAMHPIDADVKDVSVQWSSSDSSIVIIGKSNKFRGFKLGQATITATTTENPKLTASAIVYVTEDGNLPEEVITGTTRIKVSTPSKHYFDLQGRTYDKPFKGINILGGKKIVF